VRRYWVMALLTLIGAGIGATYALTIGCVTGGCPITSSPVATGLMGSVVGFMIGAELSGGRHLAGCDEPAADPPEQTTQAEGEA